MLYKKRKKITEKQLNIMSNDIEKFKANSKAVHQLLATVVNNCDLDHIKGLKEELSNSAVFMNDMYFFFSKLQNSAK